MTQRIIVSSIEGPYTLEIDVWEERSSDGSTENTRQTVETITLEPNGCTSILLWGTRGITITELPATKEKTYHE